MVGLASLKGGAIRMALLAEEPQPYAVGSWEGQRVWADGIGALVIIVRGPSRFR